RDRHLEDLETRRAELAAQQRQCCICFDDVPILRGILCRHADPAARHFTCEVCFSEHVRHTSQADLDIIERRGGKVHCPFPECPSHAFDDADVYRYADELAIAAYRTGNEKLNEKRLVEELEPTVRQQIRAELEQQALLDAEQ